MEKNCLFTTKKEEGLIKLIVMASLMQLVVVFLIFKFFEFLEYNPAVAYMILIFFVFLGQGYVIWYIRRIVQFPYVLVFENCIVNMKGKKVEKKIEIGKITQIKKVYSPRTAFYIFSLNEDDKMKITIPISLCEKFESILIQLTPITIME